MTSCHRPFHQIKRPHNFLAGTRCYKIINSSRACCQFPESGAILGLEITQLHLRHSFQDCRSNVRSDESCRETWAPLPTNRLP
jgi:hypothetical protein